MNHLWRKPPTRTQHCTRCTITRTLRRTDAGTARMGWKWVYTRGGAGIRVVPQFNRQPTCGEV